MISLEQNEGLSLSITSFNFWRLIGSKASKKAEADDKIGETVKVKVGQTLSLKLVILTLKYLKKLSQRASEATGKVLTEGFVTDRIIENKTLGLE